MQDVMFISKRENIIIKGAIKRLGEEGYSAFSVPMDKDVVSKNWDEFNLGIIYIEDILDDIFGFMLAMKLLIEECPKRFIVVGSEHQEEQLKKYIPDDAVIGKLKRPLDVSLMLKLVKWTIKPGDTQADKLKDDSAKKRATSSENPNSKKTILVIDDDPQVISLIREWLKDIYTVQPVNSGMHAKKWLMSNIPDLMLVDHEMPLISGPMLIKQLKEDERTKDIPFIFLTGKKDKDSVMEVISLKPVGYFLKPVEKDKLLETIEDFFAKRG